MKSDEERLKELFEMKDKPTPTLNDTIKRAKTFSIIRNIIISLMIFIILSTTFLIANSFALNSISHKEMMKLENWFNVALPNAYITGIQSDDRIMVGQLDYVRYRFLGNKAIVDGNYKTSYTYMPLINTTYGDASEFLFKSGGTYKEFQESRNYSRSGKLVMKFYHPLISYNNYINDLQELNNIEKDKLMEISLSFDKAYTIEEVKAMMPDNITLNWCWVDTFSEAEVNNRGNKGPEGALQVYEEYEVYGIKAIDDQGKPIKNPEDRFINSIIRGKESKGMYGRYESLFNVLSKGKTEINKEDLWIIGVVVSGDVETLKTLKNLNYIKAATIGAVADKY
ncbi:hypothetical protein J2Z44_002443 [Clostridium punense]|uniref:Sigma factor regulator C-terminal domain-containing protein n=1 Tax=Clostridium punense TaxID=1054297 RepID=A0ABS4K5R1_9CLOT|nr:MULTISPECIES: anti sigma factor C-terminal domain-containing protein [Clostridium]EQB86256.1 hypothetical protein M918_15065 [Clostridium sp. BL8]MBP2022620.1 hypothetical protein [Clostridium punense]